MNHSDEKRHLNRGAVPLHPLTNNMQEVRRTDEESLIARMHVLASARIPDPLVSVVIAAYNVAPYLENAVESVLNQTLRNLEVIIVDDHSTDSTLEIAVRLAEEDNRIRVLRTNENSGGPGVPRNTGIREARAKYYTFLDGDDELETHACKNLLEAAEDSGAQLVVGRTERFHVSTKKRTQWYGHLFSERKTRTTIAEFPGLFDDTIAAGKLYLRDFTVGSDNWLLENVHFEDLVFTARAYSEAQSIAVVPATTYFWKVYPSEERKTITAQKDDLRNLEHRLQALELVDRAIAATAPVELLDQVKRKFLRHDARIYLNHSNFADDDYLNGVIDLITPRLKSFSVDDFDRLIDVWARILYGSVLTRNLKGIRDAVLFTTARGIMSGRIVETDDCKIWQPAGQQPVVPELGSVAHHLLDITEEGLHSLPLFSTRFHHEVQKIAIEDGVVHLDGVTDMLCAWPIDGDDLSAHFQVRLRRRDYSFNVPLKWGTEHEGQLSWTAVFKFPSDVPLSRPQSWDVYVVIEGGGLSSSCPVGIRRIDIDSVAPVALSGGLGSVTGRELSIYQTVRGHMAFKYTAAPGRRYQLDRYIGAIGNRWSKSKKRRTRVTQLVGKDAGYAAFRYSPIVKNTVLCESLMGTSGWDSPRYISDALRAKYPNLKFKWVSSGGRADVPDYAESIKKNSTEYFYWLACAEYLIDNQSFPIYFHKRSGQKYLQTWHGIPLKKMGLDIPDIKFGPKSERDSLLRRAQMWDFLVAPSRYFEQTFVKSYEYTGRLIRGGTPRNDVLINQPEQQADVRRRLRLPLDKKVVLYAPTFRGDGSSREGHKLFDLQRWVESLGDDHFLVVRSHYLDRFPVPVSLRHKVLDASDYPNVNDLYLAADGLITDYSSVMFDFAVLRRPMFFFAYDYEKYVRDARGTYFDLKQEAPSALHLEFDELVEDIRRWDYDFDAHEAFIAKFVDAEDGQASQRAVAALMEASSEK